MDLIGFPAQREDQTGASSEATGASSEAPGKGGTSHGARLDLTGAGTNARGLVAAVVLPRVGRSGPVVCTEDKGHH